MADESIPDLADSLGFSGLATILVLGGGAVIRQQRNSSAARLALGAEDPLGRSFSRPLSYTLLEKDCSNGSNSAARTRR